MAHNPNCDGAHCRTVNSEVRVYPIGAGGNLILCQACFAHENRYNYERGRETEHPEWFPQINWYECELYGGAL